jgi:hypothetical protein
MKEDKSQPISEEDSESSKELSPASILSQYNKELTKESIHSGYNQGESYKAISTIY